MSEFKLTKEAAQLATKILSEDGYLDVVIEQTGKKKIKVSLCHKSITVFELDEVELPSIGSTLTLSGMKIKLDLEGVM